MTVNRSRKLPAVKRLLPLTTAAAVLVGGQATASVASVVDASKQYRNCTAR
jgi:hypothetical protein